MSDAPQVQSPNETPRTRPVTTDPVWHLLFDRLDAQDDNIKRGVDNTVVIAERQDILQQHVNEEQDKFTALLADKVGRGEVLQDLWLAFKHSRPAQVALSTVGIAMTPVIIANWGTLVESVHGFF